MFIKIKKSREWRVFPSVYRFTLQTEVKCVSQPECAWQEGKNTGLCSDTVCSSMLLLTYLCYRLDFMLIYILLCMYIHITHCPRYQCFVSSVNIIEGENHTCSSSYYAHIMSATPYYQKLICHKETAQRWISFYSSVQCTVLNFLQPAVWKPVYWRDWESTKNWYWNIVLHT